MERIYTAESVTIGHPDKLADLIADSILDECLAQDPESKVACEVMLSHNKCFIAGEITSKAKVDYKKLAKTVIEEVGYDTKNVEFEERIHSQSGDIASCVDTKEQGAGDQGIVYGYACDETNSYMPLPITLATGLTERLKEVREDGVIDYLHPDGKSQVSVKYVDGKFDSITSIIISAQHDKKADIDKLRTDIKAKIIDPVFKGYDLSKAEILINPSGRFVIGGFEADTGLTGRKLMVDTYGGRAHHGGGAMSGKDASKVDRSGAYLARYIAKNIVAAGIASECEIALSYAIGVPQPVSIDVNLFDSGIFRQATVEKAIRNVFDLSVKGSIETLELKSPIFSQTSVGGHFGKEYLRWELIDKADELHKYVLGSIT